mmetsp:Transcript_17987/g.49633  ORF Transcript_17987/g.49633 Transcript_17987/m.49633 type:complete len:187 (-) Transcript_17987:72-632(-)
MDGGPASPEAVRKKWDSLLAVVNSSTSEGFGSFSPGQPAQGQPLQAARQLLAETSSAKSLSVSPGKRIRRKPLWDDRHHLIFSNANLNKNVRSYFDRHREVEAYGLRHDAVLRTTWQLDTPEKAGEMPPPKSSTMSKSASSPAVTKSTRSSRPQWNSQHTVLFNKDNHHYHPNFREYFERPRDLLW